MKKFKNRLFGERLILKRTKPNLQLAKIMFGIIDINRKHLKPWFAWEKKTKKVEDTLKYLFDKEEKTKLGEKVEYGIYFEDNYIGNIGIFDIDKINKSAEIGYWLSSEFTRKAYMTEAVGIIEEEFFVNMKLNRIKLKCDERNKASIGLAKKCAYKLEGKCRENIYSEHFKDFRNTLIFSKLRKEYKK